MTLHWVSGIHIVFRHYNDVIMGTMASQITSLTIVYSAAYSGADQRKHQSAVSLAIVRGIHRGLPTQMASNAENVSIWWRHHGTNSQWCNFLMPVVYCCRARSDDRRWSGIWVCNLGMKTSSNGNIFRVTVLLWRKFAGHRWIFLIKANDVELWCTLWYAPDQTVEQTIEKPVILDAVALIMTPR